MTTFPKSKIESTNPPKLTSKDQAARELGCDRRTLTKVIYKYEIKPAGKSATGHKLYDLDELRDELNDHRAADLKPMTHDEALNGLFSMVELAWHAMDCLSETLPQATMQDAIATAIQRRSEKQQPRFLWMKNV